MLCEENFRAPRDRAEARVEVELPEEVDGREDWAFLDGRRLSCRAFARAFSWVRTKLARFYVHG